MPDPYGRTVAANRSSLPVRVSFHVRWNAPVPLAMPCQSPIHQMPYLPRDAVAGSSGSNGVFVTRSGGAKRSWPPLRRARLRLFGRWPGQRRKSRPGLARRRPGSAGSRSRCRVASRPLAWTRTCRDHGTRSPRCPSVRNLARARETPRRVPRQVRRWQPSGRCWAGRRRAGRWPRSRIGVPAGRVNDLHDTRLAAPGRLRQLAKSSACGRSKLVTQGRCRACSRCNFRCRPVSPSSSGW